MIGKKPKANEWCGMQTDISSKSIQCYPNAKRSDANTQKLTQEPIDPQWPNCI